MKLSKVGIEKVPGKYIDLLLFSPPLLIPHFLALDAVTVEFSVVCTLNRTGHSSKNVQTTVCTSSMHLKPLFMQNIFQWQTQVPVLWAKAAVDSGRSQELYPLECNVKYGCGTASGSAGSAQRNYQVGFLWIWARAIWRLGDVTSSSLGCETFPLLAGLFGRPASHSTACLWNCTTLSLRGHWKWISVA